MRCKRIHYRGGLFGHSSAAALNFALMEWENEKAKPGSKGIQRAPEGYLTAR